MILRQMKEIEFIGRRLTGCGRASKGRVFKMSMRFMAVVTGWKVGPFLEV